MNLQYTNAEVAMRKPSTVGGELQTVRLWFLVMPEGNCAGVGRLSYTPKFSQRDYREYTVEDCIRRFRQTIAYYKKIGFVVTRQWVEEVRG